MTKNLSSALLRARCCFTFFGYFAIEEDWFYTFWSRFRFEVDGYPDLFGAIGNPRVSIVSSIILFFNLLWVSSQLTDTLNIVSDVVYTDVKKRIFWKRRIYSFLITLLLVFIIVVEIIAFLVVSFLIKRLANNQIFLPNSAFAFRYSISWQILINVGIWILPVLVYKYVFPVKVKKRRYEILFGCDNFVWFTMTFLYQVFLSVSKGSIYGCTEHLQFFCFLLWLYSISLCVYCWINFQLLSLSKTVNNIFGHKKARGDKSCVLLRKHFSLCS